MKTLELPLAALLLCVVSNAHAQSTQVVFCASAQANPMDELYSGAEAISAAGPFVFRYTTAHYGFPLVETHQLLIANVAAPGSPIQSVASTGLTSTIVQEDWQSCISADGRYVAYVDLSTQALILHTVPS